LGITVLPRLALPELNLQGLQVRAIREDNAQRKIGLLYRRDRILWPSTRHFIEHLRAVIPIVEAALPPLEL
jgi:DNA-binding transcriptional LysR family regulator